MTPRIEIYVPIARSEYADRVMDRGWMYVAGLILNALDWCDEPVGVLLHRPAGEASTGWMALDSALRPPSGKQSSASTLDGFVDAVAAIKAHEHCAHVSVYTGSPRSMQGTGSSYVLRACREYLDAGCGVVIDEAARVRDFDPWLEPLANQCAIRGVRYGVEGTLSHEMPSDTDLWVFDDTYLAHPPRHSGRIVRMVQATQHDRVPLILDHGHAASVHFHNIRRTFIPANKAFGDLISGL